MVLPLLLAVLAVAAPQHRVDVVLHGEDEAMPQLVARLRELVERDGRTLAFTRSAAIDVGAALATAQPDDDQLAQIWLELAPDGELELLVVDGPRARALLRSVPAPLGLDEAAREALATIAASAVEAIAAGEPVGQAHDELQAAVAGRSVTPPEPRPIPRPDPTPRDASEPAPRQRDEPRPIASTPGAPAGPRLPSSARLRVAVELRVGGRRRGPPAGRRCCTGPPSRSQCSHRRADSRPGPSSQGSTACRPTSTTVSSTRA
ncbi:MAG: hypothetical protein U0168_03230 [Nannocystaceae bacterium]